MTSKESFAALEAVKAEQDPYVEEYMKIWDNASQEEINALREKSRNWEREHNKRVSEAIKNLIPEVGTKCTSIYYSDRRAGTVTKVLSPCKVEVTHNKVKCLDWFANKYEISPELDENMSKEIFTKRRNGLWIEEGQPSKDGVRLALHFHTHSIDPSF